LVFNLFDCSFPASSSLTFRREAILWRRGGRPWGR
jgi:hypothetical protein